MKRFREKFSFQLELHFLSRRVFHRRLYISGSFEIVVSRILFSNFFGESLFTSLGSCQTKFFLAFLQYSRSVAVTLMLFNNNMCSKSDFVTIKSKRVSRNVASQLLCKKSRQVTSFFTSLV